MINISLAADNKSTNKQTTTLTLNICEKPQIMFSETAFKHPVLLFAILGCENGLYSMVDLRQAGVTEDAQHA